MTTSSRPSDPIERIIYDALVRAQIEFVTEKDDRAKNLDFFLPVSGVHIEAKQFHTPRISAQMERVENIIVIQGRQAATTFAAMITAKKPAPPSMWGRAVQRLSEILR